MTLCVQTVCGYFYPRPPRGGRQILAPAQSAGPLISIHALREEGDLVRGRQRRGILISIHALREEGDPRRAVPPALIGVFLSTPSARRATPCSWPPAARNTDFYPRPPRGGRLSRSQFQHIRNAFLSTPSARRATAKTERKLSAFVSLYTSLHKLQRGACKTNRKITPLLTQTAGIPVRSVPENHVRFLFALAGYQKISTLSCANSGCNPTCSTLVW